jgi:cation:H+ antiporter
LDVVKLIAGLILLLGGGEAVVRGAAAVARKLGVSPLAIGLTVVAFGTSAPELAVNVTAAFDGQSDLSFGNITGSNLANIGLVVGCCGLIRALPIKSIVVAREIPMMMLATVVTMVMALDPFDNGGVATLDRGDGVLMLLLFSVFLYYTVGELLRQRADHPTLEDLVASEIPGAGPGVAMFRDSLLTLAGFGALLAGADLTVAGALAVAKTMGVSDVVIGIGVVAIGTSLPELAAGVMATLRGHMEIAIGNVVGSNIFNLLLVLATTVIIRPIEVPKYGMVDLAAIGVLSVALLVFSLTNYRRILRAEAAILLLLYSGYMIWRAAILPAQGV